MSWTSCWWYPIGGRVVSSVEPNPEAEWAPTPVDAILGPDESHGCPNAIGSRGPLELWSGPLCVSTKPNLRL
jgi:hypothetical protein